MRNIWCAGIVALAAVLATACSSSGAGHATSAPPTAGSSTASAPSSGTSSTTGDADTRAITAAYGTFFNSTTTLAASVGVLQHGAQLKDLVNTESDGSYAQGAHVDVTSVHLDSAGLATVRFTIKTGGISVPFSGRAVREGGVWKVAAQTFCQLLQLQGKQPALCKDPAILRLPS